MATCNVNGLFAHLIPQEARADKEVQKARKVMIPRLPEMKFYCGKTHYRPGRRQRRFVRAVDRRAGELMEEYRGKAEKMDRLLGEEEEGRGRVRRRLDQFGELIGIVSGVFNEASSDTLMLLDVMAT